MSIPARVSGLYLIGLRKGSMGFLLLELNRLMIIMLT